jgi:hypothetical protein
MEPAACHITTSWEDAWHMFCVSYRSRVPTAGETDMADTFTWESFKADSAQFAKRLKQLIQEGNLRRIIVQHKGQTVAEFPVTAGVVGVVIAPVMAAVGALVALLKDCTIHVEVNRNPAAPPFTPTREETPADEPADVEC